MERVILFQSYFENKPPATHRCGISLFKPVDNTVPIGTVCLHKVPD